MEVLILSNASRPATITGPRASAMPQASAEGDQDADVIVVGAGPGGSAAATFLSRQGLDVLLLEKSQFPREKVCGDGLTPRAVRMLVRLGIDTSTQAGWLHNKGLRIYGGRVDPFDMPWPELSDFPDYGMVCPRSVFDDLLAGTAVEAGTRLHTGVRVTGPIRHERSGRVVGVTDASGRSWRAPIVIGADGNSARLAVQVGREHDPKRPMGVAVRSYYTSPRHDMDWMESYLELWDGERGQSNLLPGYGWVFGMGDGTSNVGLGVLNTSKGFGQTDYRALLKRWVDHTPEEWGFRDQNMVGKIQGAALPMAFNRQPHYGRGLVLVGDAGGMVNPFNGEGIAYAMEAAEYAAMAIAEASSRGFGSASAEKAMRAYPEQMKASLGGYYRLGTIFVKLIGDPRIMHLCTRYGLPRKTLMRFVLKLLANLTDSHGGDAMDRIINALCKAAPSA